VGWVVLAAVLCTGCGGTATSGKSTTAGTVADDPRDAATVAPRELAPSSSAAVVTLHVKDMGTKLNLL
jgi:hypothetical protein